MAERRGRAARIGFMRHAQPVFKRVDRYLDASARVLLGASGREGVDAAMDEALHKVGPPRTISRTESGTAIVSVWQSSSMDGRTSARRVERAFSEVKCDGW